MYLFSSKQLLNKLKSVTDEQVASAETWGVDYHVWLEEIIKRNIEEIKALENKQFILAVACFLLLVKVLFFR